MVLTGETPCAVGEVYGDSSGDPFRFALYVNVEEAGRIMDHALKGEMHVHE